MKLDPGCTGPFTSVQDCPVHDPRRTAALTSDALAELLAQRFHEAYERLAPSFGYETRPESARPWADVPERNRRLMIAVCAELLRGSPFLRPSDEP